MLRLVGVLGYAQKALLVRLCVISTKIVVCLTEKSIGFLCNWCVYRCVHGLCGSSAAWVYPKGCTQDQSAMYALHGISSHGVMWGAQKVATIAVVDVSGKRV
jgi:hypothetical protein